MRQVLGRRGQTDQGPSAVFVAGFAMMLSVALAPALLPVMYPAMSASLPSYTTTHLGVSTSILFGVATLAAPVAGRWADQADSRTVAATAAVISTAALLLLSASPGVWAIMVGAVLAGAAKSIGTTGSSVIMAPFADHRAAGFAFGTKQAAVPLASVIAGVATGALAPSLGWRALVVLFVTWPVAVLLLANRLPGPNHPVRDRDGIRLGLLVAVALLSGTATGGFSTFAVVRLVDLEVSASVAAGIFSVGAAGSVVTRLAAGHIVDRWALHPAALLSVLFFAGSLGAAATALDAAPAAILGVVVAYAFGWGGPGLYQLHLAAAFTSSVGRATGLSWLATGMGVTLGPMLFLGVQRVGSTELSWLVVAACWILAAVASLRVARTPTRPSPVPAMTQGHR